MKILVDNEFRRIFGKGDFELWTNDRCFVSIQYDKDLISVALPSTNRNMGWSNRFIKRFNIPFTQFENMEILDYVLSL